jgi:hypothetical protein
VIQLSPGAQRSFPLSVIERFQTGDAGTAGEIRRSNHLRFWP